ncbi:MAG: TadE/TadG family type IV pilus assembly protein [Hyphomicrobiales bacterium]
MFGRFKRNSDGSSMIEFGMIAMPFLALLIAIFETTLIFFTQSALETGVANAGRMIRTGQVQADGITENQFKGLVCDSLAGYLDCNSKVTVDVRSFSDFASISLPAALDEDGELAGGTEFTPGDSSEVVVVRVFYVWDMMTPDHFTGLSNMSGTKRLIAAASAFRNEPF